MARVVITINGRSYEVACDDGEEEHVRRLGQFVDRRVGELTQTVGQVGEVRLLMMASLTIADELAEVYAQLAAERQRDAGAASVDESAAAREAEAMEAIAGSIGAEIAALAERIESVAARLKPT